MTWRCIISHSKSATVKDIATGRGDTRGLWRGSAGHGYYNNEALRNCNRKKAMLVGGDCGVTAEETVVVGVAESWQ